MGKDLGNKKVAVLGLGLEGKDLVKLMIESGVDIAVLSQKEKRFFKL